MCEELLYWIPLSRVPVNLRRTVRRLAWIGLLCLVAAAFLSACGKGSQPTVTPTPTAADTTAEGVAVIRAIVEAYWTALNDYDVDRALPMLEPDYRAAEEELIRSDIELMERFRVKLDISEEIPPALNADGDYETYLTLKTPVDTRRLLMVFRPIDGEWWIVFSDEVE